MITDPGSRHIVAAVKKGETATTTHAMPYEADKITRLLADQTGAVSGYRRRGHREPARRSPRSRAAQQRPTDRRWDSEIEDLKPLVDSLNKSLADMMVTSEYVGRPRRWASGIELTRSAVLDEDGLDDRGDRRGQPDPRRARAMISEN